MSKFIEEFKKFAFKGNMIDMAVGIIIGGAFGKIVTSLVNDVIMPPIGALIGNKNFADLAITLKQASVDAAGNAVPAVTLNYGNFIQVLIDFLIVALVIFLVIKGMNRLGEAAEKVARRAKNAGPEETAEQAEPAAPAPPAEPVPTKEEALLAEIRDLLKDSNKKE